MPDSKRKTSWPGSVAGSLSLLIVALENREPERSVDRHVRSDVPRRGERSESNLFRRKPMSSEGDGSDYGGEVAGHEPKKRSAGSVKTRQHHIAQIAQNYADSPLTTLAHHLDLLWMHTAFAQVRKDSAPGIDGMTAAEYAKNAGANLADLLERAKSGRYKAPPVKRKWIPKNEHELRAIGIPTLEDKILQRAIAMLLEPLYEQDFLDCSYGFRPRRSAHQALN